MASRMAPKMTLRTTTLMTLVACAVCALLALPAQAGVSTDCGTSLRAPATLVSAVVVDADGHAVRGAVPAVEGRELELAGLGRLGDGAGVQVNDEIARGILRNAGEQPVMLTFASGETVLLAADEEVAVDEGAQCECWCTCAAGSTSKVFKFPCDGNSDDCDYFGELCRWVDENGTHVGTYTLCFKIWVLGN